MVEHLRQRFWKHTRRWTGGLLGVWLAVNLALPWFARDLDRWQIFGFPLGYWFAAEGALLVYLLIIVIYVVVMDRMEAALERDEDDAASAAGGTAGAGATRADTR